MKSKIVLKKIEEVNKGVYVVEFFKNDTLYKVYLRDEEVSLVFKNEKEYSLMCGERENFKRIIDRLQYEENFLHDDGIFKGLENVYKELSERFEVPMEKIDILMYSANVENDLVSCKGEIFVRYNNYTNISYEFHITFGKLYNEVYDIRIDEV